MTGHDDPNGSPTPELPKEVIESIKRQIIFGEDPMPRSRDTRFKPGQSGNPAGRPKSTESWLDSPRSANSLILREARRRIPVREGDKSGEMTAIEAVLRKQIATALGGNAYAQKHVGERYDCAERDERERRTRRIEFWTDYVADGRKAIADAKAKGEAPPVLLPHPDDVVIDDEKGIDFIGPLNDEQLAMLEDTLKFRDVLIMQDALDRRLGDDEAADPLDRPGGSYVLADYLNKRLPERYRLSDTIVLMRMRRYEGMPKRDLLKELYRSWRAIGRPLPRGTTFPSVRLAIRVISEAHRIMNEAQRLLRESY